MLLSLQRLGWLVMFQIRKLLVMWLQLDIHSIMQLGFTRKVGESAFFSMILWSVKHICAFRLRLLKITNLPLYEGDKCSCSYYQPITSQLRKHCLNAADFFKESSRLVDSLATNSSQLLILGDFNILWDCQRNLDTKQLADILRSANIRQRV